MAPTHEAQPPHAAPPEAWEPLLRLARFAYRPLEKFLRIQAASGVVLIVAAVAALAWANSPWGDSYTHLWETPLGLRVGPFAFERPLHWVINDGLMVIFFFVVGLEIRREMHHGELSDLRRATLPLVAALGGMAAPALVYLAVAGAQATRSGWGVPMATDIAFAVGVFALLGHRVPAALRILLLAVAVIDDLGAIVVIALFYSSGIAWSGLGVAVLGVGGILLLQWLGVRSRQAYVVPALIIWAGVYASGVHPTIAGVLIGLLTPVRAWLGPQGFLDEVKGQVGKLADADLATLSPHALAGLLGEVDSARREAMSPAESLIELLHPWVAFFIMPVFALANAGVDLRGLSLDGSTALVAVGAALGLIIGKPVGIFGVSMLALKVGLARLPKGLTTRHVVVLGLVAGIGFTMSLFIAQLAFADHALLGAAKLGVLAASGFMALVGCGVGYWLLRPHTQVAPPPSVDEAEHPAPVDEAPPPAAS